MEAEYGTRSFRIWVIALVMATITAGIVGCSPGSVASAELLRSDKPRSTVSQEDTARIPQLVDGNTEFALDLYHSPLLKKVLFSQPRIRDC